MSMGGVKSERSKISSNLTRFRLDKIQKNIPPLSLSHLFLFCVLSLVFPERIFYLCAKSGVEADEWIKILRWKMVSIGEVLDLLSRKYVQ